MFKPTKESTALIVIDIQERLTPAMDQELYASMRDNVERLIKGAKVLGLPILTTQQYTKGLGGTVEDLACHLEDDAIEKTTFSCCGEKAFLDTLKEKGVDTVVLCGMETHVCVLQTAIDLIYEGFDVQLVADAVCSRNKDNRDIGIGYMATAGALVTCTETILFQLVGDAKAPEFKEISKIVK